MPPRQQTPQQPPRYAPEPEPADYSDEVTEKDLEALREMVGEDLDAEEWEIVDGPAW